MEGFEGQITWALNTILPEHGPEGCCQFIKHKLEWKEMGFAERLEFESQHGHFCSS